MVVCLLLVGLAFLILGTACALDYLDSKDKQFIESMDKSKPIETYGHRIDVFHAIKKTLPPAPNGHMWEMSVEFIDSHPRVTVKLLTMQDEKVVSKKTSASLTHNRYDRLWASEYERWKTIKGTVDRDVMDQIVDPVITWATKEAYKITGVPQRYEIIG